MVEIDDSNAAATLDAFVRRARLWHRVASLLMVACAQAIVLFVAVWIVDIAIPRWRVPAIGAAVLLWVVSAVIVWVRSQASIPRLDREYGLGDALRAWCDARDLTPMRGWLGRSLAIRLDGLPAGPRSKPIRRRLRPLRYLVPILVAVLILHEIAPEQPGEPPIGPSAVALVPDDESGTEPKPVPGDETDDTDDPGTDEPSADGVSDPPQAAPVQDRPTADDFALPSFVGEGPSSLADAHVADVATGGDGEGANSVASAGAGPLRDVPDAMFERAVERALSGRHVREDEIEIVRAYFRALMEQRR